jgi:hypothetical protein
LSEIIRTGLCDAAWRVRFFTAFGGFTAFRGWLFLSLLKRENRSAVDRVSAAPLQSVSLSSPQICQQQIPKSTPTPTASSSAARLVDHNPVCIFNKGTPAASVFALERNGQLVSL